MVVSSGSELYEKSFRIKHDEKFFSRLLSKDSSKANNPSFRVYYGDVSSAVPFVWESQPGTPKHPSYYSDSVLPPLTPPPSYFNSGKDQPMKREFSSRSKLLLHTLLRRIGNSTMKKPHINIISSPSSSSSLSTLSSRSSSHSSFYSQKASLSDWRGRRRRFQSRGSSFDDRMVDLGEGSSSSEGGERDTLGSCFGTGKDRNSSGFVRSGCSIVVVKKALLSIVGRGGSGKLAD